MNRSVNIVVICEDRQHECFVRRFLKQRGYRNHHFRFVTSPRGRGSGEQWARQNLPAELESYRQRQHRAQTRLLAIMDVDNRTVADCIRAFEQACANRGVAFRENGEQVAFALPMRNIESWLAYLRGEAIDETTTYPKLRHESECEDEARTLHAMCQTHGLRDPVPASLDHACEEFARLDL